MRKHGRPDAGIFCSLPRDLLVVILHCWTCDIRDFARLDSACTNYAWRNEFLELLRSALFDWSSKLPLKALSCTSAQLLQWISRRQINTCLLPLCISQIESLMALSINCSSFRGVTTMKIIDDQRGNIVSAQSLGSFFHCDTAINPLAIDCSAWPDVFDHQIIALIGVPLSSLRLNACYNITADALCTLLEHCGQSLEEIHIDSITLHAKAIHCLGSFGKQLKSLEILACRISSSLLSRLLMHCSRLVHLKLCDIEGSVVDDWLVRCFGPSLQSLSLSNCSSISFNAVQFILRSCPDLHSLSITEKVFLSYLKECGSLVIQCCYPPDQTGIRMILEHASRFTTEALAILIPLHPIDHSVCEYLTKYVSRRTFSRVMLGVSIKTAPCVVRSLIQPHLYTLATFSLFLSRDIPMEDFEQYDFTIFEDIIVNLISYDHPHLTDRHLVPFLSVCKKIGMLRLDGCIHLTDRTLVNIQHHAVVCTTVSLQQTAVSTCGVLQFLLDMGHKVKTVVISRKVHGESLEELLTRNPLSWNANLCRSLREKVQLV